MALFWIVNFLAIRHIINWNWWFAWIELYWKYLQPVANIRHCRLKYLLRREQPRLQLLRGCFPSSIEDCWTLTIAMYCYYWCGIFPTRQQNLRPWLLLTLLMKSINRMFYFCQGFPHVVLVFHYFVSFKSIDLLCGMHVICLSSIGSSNCTANLRAVARSNLAVLYRLCSLFSPSNRIALALSSWERTFVTRTNELRWRWLTTGTRLTRYGGVD